MRPLQISSSAQTAIALIEQLRRLGFSLHRIVDYFPIKSKEILFDQLTELVSVAKITCFFSNP